MRYSSDDLHAAANAGLIAESQLAPLLTFLGTRTPTTEGGRAAPVFDVVHMLWYAGALIVIGAMGLFSTLAFSQMGGQALAITAFVYAALFGVSGHYLWTTKKLHTPGGLLIAVAVSMAPLAVYGIQDALGLWTRFGKPGTVHDFYTLIKGSWVVMEIAAIVAAAVALRFYRFPFIVLIAAFALWFMSMDIVPWISGKPSGNFEFNRQVVDLVRSRRDRCRDDRQCPPEIRRLRFLAVSVRRYHVLGRRKLYLRRHDAAEGDLLRA